MAAKHIIWVESEQAFRIIDNDGTAFVSNYSKLEDAEHALYLMCRDDLASLPEGAVVDWPSQG